MKMCKAVPTCRCTDCKMCQLVWGLSEEATKRLIEILTQEEEKYQVEKEGR